MDNFNFKKRVLFIGVPDMAFIGLDTLHYSGVNIVGVVGPKKTHSTYESFKMFVNSRNLNFIEYDRLDSPELLGTISDLNIDIGVVCSFNNRIPKIFMEKIKDGIINIHPSLLPLYRGGNPYSWVIINNESKSGVTLHYMSENFDEGDIIQQVEIDVNKNETMGTIFSRTNIIGCKMLLGALIKYEKEGPLKGIPQQQGDFIKAPNIKDEETFIDFNKSAEYIERFVRALNPYITAVSVFKGNYIKFHKVSVEHIENIEGFENGQICKIENDKLYIKTSDGCVCPEVLQYGGEFIGDVKDFIDIAKPKLGDKFNG